MPSKQKRFTGVERKSKVKLVRKVLFQYFIDIWYSLKASYAYLLQSEGIIQFAPSCNGREGRGLRGCNFLKVTVKRLVPTVLHFT